MQIWRLIVGTLLLQIVAMAVYFWKWARASFTNADTDKQK